MRLLQNILAALAVHSVTDHYALKNRRAVKPNAGQVAFAFDDTPSDHKWDESAHPRAAKGAVEGHGGEFVAKGSDTVPKGFKPYTPMLLGSASGVESHDEKAAPGDDVPVSDTAKSRDPVAGRILSNYPKAEHVSGHKHLIATINAGTRKAPEKRGIFLVNNDTRTLDRTAYREMADEAKKEGLGSKMHVYGRIATYTGPGVEFLSLLDAGIKEAKPGIAMPEKPPNEAAKPGDQLGLFGEASKPKREGPATLGTPGTDTKGKAQELFDTKGPANQMDLFGDGVMPDDLVNKDVKIPPNVEQAHADMQKAHAQRKSHEPTQKKDANDNEFAPGVSYSTIPLSAGMAAHRGTSFVPETRGRQRQKEFAHSMNAAYAELKQSTRGNEAKQKQLDEQWVRFVDSAKSKYLAALHADSRTMSTMITGGSNFPTARNRKKLDSAMNRWNEYSEFVDRATKAIHRDLHPELSPKKIGDADTGAHIETELDRRKKQQEHMKAANKILKQAGVLGYWRGAEPKFHDGHTQESTISKLMQIEGVDEAKAKSMLKPDVMNHIGYATYELSNNNANIRRYEKQLQRQSKFESEAKVAESAGEQATSHDFKGGKVHLDYDDNRIRIAHDTKPSADVIAKLKSKGFRWSPANKAWQRQLTNAAKYDAHTLTGVAIDKLTPKAEKEDKPEKPAEIVDRKRDHWLNIESGLNVSGKHKLSDGTVVSYEYRGDDANDRYVVLEHPDGTKTETHVTDAVSKKAKRSDMQGIARHVATQYIKTKYSAEFDEAETTRYSNYEPILLESGNV